MATLTLMLDTRNKKAEIYPLVIRVRHKRIPKNIQLGYKLSKEQWNEEKNLVKSTYPNSKKANHIITKKWTIAHQVISEYNPFLENLTVYEVVDLINAAFKNDDEEKLKTLQREKERSHTYLKLYGEKVIKRYTDANRYGMADNLKGAISLFIKYNGGDDLPLSAINQIFLEDLEAWYLSKNNRPVNRKKVTAIVNYKQNSLNGLGVSLRGIRRIFNLAIKDPDTELTLEHYPFGKQGYSIKQQRTKKRAVNLEVIDQIKNLDCEPESPIWHHKNYFLVNFYMRGMNFMDMAYIKVGAIHKGRLKYKRRKTRRGGNVKEFDILIPEAIKDIFDYYTNGKKKDDLIFPIIDDVINTKAEGEVHEIYKNRRRNHNRRLGTIGRKLNLDTKLTTYVGRHTFATAGLHKGISKAQIGDMLGHTNYYTTEAYFADFENEVLDQAADKIFN